jgi:glycosyltransferase involved in cell wall biosynthesis
MLASLRSQVGPSVRLAAWIVGDGPLAARTQEELVRHGLDDWVALTGRLDRPSIRDLCHRADLYVAPATRESFGIAALESRAAGLPIVAMRSGGVRDFVRDGVEGLLADSDEEMARVLAVLAVDGPRRARIAAHNRAVPPSEDWPIVAAGYDHVYAEAHDVARPRRTRPGRVLWRTAPSQ